MFLSEISSERAVRRIDMTPLKRHFTTNLNLLVRLMDLYGFKLRIVGGAVRDVLLGLTPRDIDLITDALPDAVMYILGKHNIPYKTKGIPHGTIKVNFPDGEEYEITSLGYQIEDDCCPPNIIVHSGESWRGDAQRRDFTVDTMSVDFDGLLYDYLNGIQDLRNHYVRFIGSPSERIQKDPILIMRFFKLLSLFRDPKFDKGLVPLLKQKMKLVKKIKPDRMAKEIGNIKRGPSADKVLKMMKNLGFDDVVKIAEAVEDYNTTRLRLRYLLNRHQMELTQWEHDFVLSVGDRLKRNIPLSPKQQPIVDKLFRKYGVGEQDILADTPKAAPVPAPQPEPIQTSIPDPYAGIQDRKLPPEAYLAEMAQILRTNVKNVPRRMLAMHLGVTCSRCGGSGNYSYNQMHGTTCFGCGGHGVVVPTKSRQWEYVLGLANKAVEDGKLDQYLHYLKAMKTTKNAMDKIFEAWKSTIVAPLYNQNWRDIDTNSPLYMANKRMADVADQVQNLTRSIISAKGDDLHRLTVELEQAIQVGLQEIQDAELWYKQQTGQG